MKVNKFRIWDKGRNAWHRNKEDAVHLFGENTLLGYIDVRPDNSRVRIEELNDLVEMQYTGIKDKNGVEIYEGDILQFSDKWEWYRGRFGGGWFATQADKDLVENDHVKYPYERRTVTLPSGYEWLLSGEIQTYFEVIGNIYDNPELLEKNDSTETKNS